MSPPNSEPAASPEPPSAADLAPTTAGASAGQLVFLVLGILLFAALWALPVVLMLWLGSSALGGLGIAEALERTRGLAPGTFGGAFWLAGGFTALMAVLEARAILRGSKELGLLATLLTRPVTGLLVLFVPTLLLVRVDLRGTDVPDILTTTLLLCCLGYVCLILPLALLSTSWRLARWMWRVGRRSGFASGALGTLGLAFASCVPLLCATSDDRSPPDPDFQKLGAAIERGFERAEREDLVDGSLTVLRALAEVIPNDPEPPSSPPWLGEGSKDLFDTCIDLLHRDPDGTSARDETIRYFVARGTDRSLATQIVQETLLELCLGHAKHPYADLKQRFRWLSQNRRKNNWRRQNLRDSCSLAVQHTYYDVQPPSPEAQADFLALNRALCSLEDPRDQEILRLWAMDHEADEIGRRLDPPMTAASVRQRKKRALDKLRARLN